MSEPVDLPTFTLRGTVQFLREPPPEASDAEIVTCLRLDHLTQDDAMLILSGLVDVPIMPPKRLRLLPWERSWGMVLHAEQVFCAGLDRGRIRDMDNAKWNLDRARCRAQVARLNHELRRPLHGRRLQLLSSTRNLAALVEGEHCFGNEVLAFSFHTATPAAQVRKLLIVYDRGRALGEAAWPA
ncbi:hypothetical protein MKK84_03460 [Methylobacterium sp. E-065]|uniref:hypothetical protein n=1 Tax=Methylobacterium sp. E-065 TaxID=2836583 RepID=UPI001FBBDA04|nr:hypothetical protein [Methylobacterium sp. E-065]MCJ2016489.1 hypothetical protein [Methylobacterium sp. E-065]